MSRILVLVVVGVMLFGGLFAAGEMLDNPDVEPNATADQDQQTNFAETSGTFFEIAPVAFFALVVGVILAGVRRVG